MLMFLVTFHIRVILARELHYVNAENGKSKYLICSREPEIQLAVGVKPVLIFIERSPGAAFLKPN